MNSIFVIGFILLLFYLFAMVAVVQIKKDNSIGNFTWGGGCLLLTLYTFFTTSLYLARQILVTVLIVLWSVRLIIYLYSRYKKGADPRFIAWQNQWGRYALLISIGWILFLQGALLLVMALPSVWINTHVSGLLALLDLIGLLVWLIGFICESISDYQLYRFMHDPGNKGKIMDAGLWHYSRHPNYFGEILMWWGIYLIAIAVPYGWITLITPLTITILLVFFTGIPWVEAVFKDNQAYQAYKQRTSMLIPWWPKSSSGSTGQNQGNFDK